MTPTPFIPTYLPETPSQTAGPYVHIGLIPKQAGFEIFENNFGGDIAGPGVTGERIIIEGRIFDGAGHIISIQDRPGDGVDAEIGQPFRRRICHHAQILNSRFDQLPNQVRAEKACAAGNQSCRRDFLNDGRVLFRALPGHDLRGPSLCRSLLRHSVINPQITQISQI